MTPLPPSLRAQRTSWACPGSPLDNPLRARHARQFQPRPMALARGAYATAPMRPEQTTVLIQRYLDRIAGDAHAETLVRELLAQSVQRLHRLCANLLHRRYPRLARPPMNLQAEDLLSAVVARLMHALRRVRPGNVRQ